MLMKVRNILQQNSWSKRSLFMLIIAVMMFYGLRAEADVWQPSSNHQQIPIWPESKMPDALPITKPESMTIGNDFIAGKPVNIVWDVTQPTITIYSPTTKKTSAAVIVFPGQLARFYIKYNLT